MLYLFPRASVFCNSGTLTLLTASNDRCRRSGGAVFTIAGSLRTDGIKGAEKQFVQELIILGQFHHYFDSPDRGKDRDALGVDFCVFRHR